MRPLKLTLKHFHGIKSGLNRDELTLDLTGLRGLVALTGPNGTGKTTVLDSLHPYRLMPFRAAGYSPRQFSYYDETFGEARKVLEWEHAGRHYKSDIIIKGANKTKKTEAYLFVQADGEWLPATTRDGQPSDGKTDTYDAVVDEILGAPEFFFTAIYAAQGRKPFSDYAPGEIKTLLSDLLGLDEPLALSAKAAEAVKYLTARQDALRDRVAEFDAALADHATALHEQQMASTRLGWAGAERQQARGGAEIALHALSEARAAQAAADDLRRRRQELADRLVRLQRDEGEAVQRLGTERRQLQTDVVTTERAREVERINGRITALMQRRTATQARIDAAPQAEDLTPQVQAAEAAIADLDRQIQEADAAAKAGQQHSATVSRLQAERAAALNAGKTQAATIAAERERAKLIETVPCAGMDLSKACPLLANAHAAKNALPALEEDIARVRTAYADLTRELAEAEAENQRHQLAVARLESLRRQRPTLESALHALRARQASTGAIDTLRAQLAQIEQDEAAEKAALAIAMQAVESRRAEVALLLADVVARCDHTQAQFEADRKAAQAQLDQMPPVPSAEGLADAEQRHLAAQNRLSEAEGAYHAASTAEATATARIAATVAAMDRTRRFREEASALSDDIAQWKLTAKGLGKDGIVALSIDDAGPSIAAIANDLLLACYGPRFTLKFETQTETKDGRPKETFDIRVLDAERNEEKGISKTSGGERLWLNECLSRAIALFRVQASGAQYQTNFADESDGALDPERKRHFMRMKRQVLALGGFDSEFFISHEPELWDMADHRIDLSTYRVTQ